jgi:intracellular sulfur oxidation DsrE/DsrF family protein
VKKLKVLFHVNENEKWDVALGNIINLLKDVGEGGVEVSVLANGPSVAAYADEGKLAAMNDLAQKGVVFNACSNSLTKMCSGGTVCIHKESLPEFIHIVPAGITEIIRKQAEGYAYVKP